MRDSSCRPLAGTGLSARYRSHRLEAVVCHSRPRLHHLPAHRPFRPLLARYPQIEEPHARPYRRPGTSHLSTRHWRRPFSAAARSAGVHRNTIAHWRRTVPAFAQSLASAQYDRALHWRDLAEEQTALAISALRDLLADPKTPPATRLKAALAVLKESTTPPPAPPVIVPEEICRIPGNAPDPAAGSQPEAPYTPEELEILHNLAPEGARQASPRQKLSVAQLQNSAAMTPAPAAADRNTNAAVSPPRRSRSARPPDRHRPQAPAPLTLLSNPVH